MDNNSKHGKFQIYQLRSKECGYRFMGTHYIRDFGLKINRKDYDKVYEGALHAEDTLETLYERFNFSKPKDYHGRSLSVSDVVVFEQDGDRKAFFIDNIGQVELKHFLREKNVGEKPRQVHKQSMVHPRKKQLASSR